ncbi:hypothetical protein [Natranaerovirga hydrolytica]|nr:hypothetical protein [Natranaerovirga hydrolytica]
MLYFKIRDYKKPIYVNKSFNGFDISNQVSVPLRIEYTAYRNIFNEDDGEGRVWIYDNDYEIRPSRIETNYDGIHIAILHPEGFKPHFIYTDDDYKFEYVLIRLIDKSIQIIAPASNSEEAYQLEERREKERTQ